MELPSSGPLALLGGIIAAWMAVLLALPKVLDRLEDVVKEESAQLLIRAIQERRLYRLADELQPLSVRVFHFLFGEAHLSRRSCIASAISSYLVTYLLAAWLVLREPDPVVLDPEGLVKLALSVLIVTSIVALIPNWLSLLKTRSIIDRMRNSASTPVVLIVDLLFSFCLGLCVVVVLVAPLGEETMLLIPKICSLSEEAAVIALTPENTVVVGGLSFAGDGNGVKATLPIGIWFYAAFLPSAFAWLMGLVVAIAALVAKLEAVQQVLYHHFRFDKKPLAAVAYLLYGTLTVALIALTPILLLVQKLLSTS